MKLMYKGETKDGTVCQQCGGRPVDAKITSKEVFGYKFKVNKPIEVRLEDFNKLMATGLFDVI